MGDCHEDNVSLVDLKVGQAVMLERIDNMQKDVNTKHEENQRDKHKFRNDIQNIANDVWKLKIKIAGYSAVGGAIAAVIGKLIEHALK